MFIGIDLTSSEKKPTAYALLDETASLRGLGFKRTDNDILGLVAGQNPAIVAIDAPLGFPKGMDCLEESCPCRSDWEFKGRRCEREVIDRGMSIYVTTKRTFIKQMVYRAIKLANDLKARGHLVIEVYPYASKVSLFGRPIPKKTSREGMAFLRERLGELVGGLGAIEGRLGHDLGDAIIAAYTGYLGGLGQTEAMGVEEEGRIVIPRTP